MGRSLKTTRTATTERSEEVAGCVGRFSQLSAQDVVLTEGVWMSISGSKAARPFQSAEQPTQAQRLRTLDDTS